jgi:hypothetical protein
MDPHYSPHIALDDVMAIVTDPPESVDLDQSERALDIIASWMTDEEVNAVSDFIDRMRYQEHISEKVYTSATEALNKVHQAIYGVSEIKRTTIKEAMIDPDPWSKAKLNWIDKVRSESGLSISDVMRVTNFYEENGVFYAEEGGNLWSWDGNIWDLDLFNGEPFDPSSVY